MNRIEYTLKFFLSVFSLVMDFIALPFILFMILVFVPYRLTVLMSKRWHLAHLAVIRFQGAEVCQELGEDISFVLWENNYSLKNQFEERPEDPETCKFVLMSWAVEERRTVEGNYGKTWLTRYR